MARIGWVGLVFLVGCEVTGPQHCQRCAKRGEVCLVHQDVEEVLDSAARCEARPAECTGDDPCAIDECMTALYDLCDEGYTDGSWSCGVRAGHFAFDITCSPERSSTTPYQ